MSGQTIQSESATVLHRWFGMPRYGRVRLPDGRVIYRDYGRPLRNGRGLTWINVRAEQLSAMAARMWDDAGWWTRNRG